MIGDKKVLFSGMQATGNLTLGNYLGALKNWVTLSDEYECFYSVVDMHSITVRQDPATLRKRARALLTLYIAAGLDPEKNCIYYQSHVSGHAELAWILNCFTYMGELNRMTQFKDKGKGKESAPTGLFMYPVLMAADILLYDTDIVPVGIDQKQHIELTRDLCNRVNNKYGETFVLPEGRYLKEGAKIMALDDPTKKMSKSAENELSRISLLDDEAKIKKAIMRATTDSDGTIKFDQENKPGISNLMNIYTAFSDLSIEDIEKKYEGKGYGDFKKDLVEILVNGLAPMKQRFEEIRYSDELIEILKDGAKRANAIAEKVVERTKKNMGVGLPR